MADFNEIGYQPVARPTEQFVGPGIRRSAAGSQALQLAGALKGFSKDAEEVYNRRFQAYVQASEAQADRIDAQGVYHNQEQLKAAVSRGEIPAHSNPWLMVRLRQNIARNEAMDAAAAAHNDLRQNEVFHKDSPEAVSQFLDQKIAGVVQGRDAWEIAAMQPELDKARHNIMSDWMDTRGQERIRESRATFGSIVSKRMDEWNAPLALSLQHGEPAAHQALEGMVHDLKDELTAQGAVVDWATANQWFTEAVLQAAREKRDPSLAQYILDRIDTKGGVLSKTAENRAALERLPREIAELKNADARSEIETRRLQSTKQAMDLVELGGKLMAEQGKGSILDVDVPTSEIQQKFPLAWAEYQKMVATMASDYGSIKNSEYMRKLDPITAEAFGKAARGELSQPDSMKLAGAMALLGEPGRQASEGLFRFLYHQKGASYGATKPDTLADMNKALMSGTLTVDKVLQAYRELSLDQNDTQTYLKLASQLEASGGATARQTAPVAESLRQLADLIEHPYLEQGLIGGAGSSQFADQLKDKQAQAEAAFIKEYYLKLVKSPEWATLSFSEQHKQIEELRDSVAKSFGGPTMADYLKPRAEFNKPEPAVPPRPAVKPAEAQAKQPAEKAKAPADPFVNDLSGGVLDSARKALSVKTANTLQEVMGSKAFDEAVMGPRMELSAGKISIQDRYGKLGLNTVESLADFRSRIISGTTTSFLRGTKPSEANAYDDPNYGVVQHTEAQLWGATMAKLQALKPEAVAAKQSILDLTTEFDKTGTLNFDQQQQLKAALITTLSFHELRRVTGYTTEEVKEAGDGAWRSMPMFANPYDLKLRGPSIAKEVGVKDFQLGLFFEAQLHMLKDIRGSGTDVNLLSR